MLSGRYKNILMLSADFFSSRIEFAFSKNMFRGPLTSYIMSVALNYILLYSIFFLCQCF